MCESQKVFSAGGRLGHACLREHVRYGNLRCADAKTYIILLTTEKLKRKLRDTINCGHI